MDIYWLEKTESDVPPGDEWLSWNERITLASLGIPKRHDDWRLGRWTAKCAICAYLKLARDGTALACVELRTTPSGAPEAFLDCRPTPVTLSLSHSNGAALCAIAPEGAEIGCDLEKVEPRGAAFLADYFTAAEREWIAQAPVHLRDRLLTLLWSAKESSLKALRCGLRSDTRAVDVAAAGELQPGEGWREICAAHTSGRKFHGWWRNSGDFVWTVIADPQPRQPIALEPMGKAASVGGDLA